MHSRYSIKLKGLKKYADVKLSLDLSSTVRSWDFYSKCNRTLLGNLKQEDKNPTGYCCVENRLKKNKSRSKMN